MLRKNEVNIEKSLSIDESILKGKVNNYKI